MRRFLAAGFLVTIPAWPQPEPATGAAFEVASVKLNKSGAKRMGFNYEPGGLVIENLPLPTILAIAYDLPLRSDRISGGPAWVREENFDIDAKAALPPALPVKARQAQMRAMLRALLADRFRLKLAEQTKQLPVYAIAVSKGGAKLKKAALEEDDCPRGPTEASSCHILNGGQGRGLHGRAVDLEDVARFLSNWTDRPVIDKTGLTGLFEISTGGWLPMRPNPPRTDGSEPTAEEAAAADPARPTLGTILGRLGLRLESQKSAVASYEIERIEKPSGN